MIEAIAWPLLVRAGGLASPGGMTPQRTNTGQKASSEPVEKTIVRFRGALRKLGYNLTK